MKTNLLTSLIVPMLAVLPLAATAGGLGWAGDSDGAVAPAVDAGPAGRWDGPYVGGQLSYAGVGDDRVGLWDTKTGAWLGHLGKLEHSGLMGRINIGHRWTTGSETILGVQAGLAAGNVDDEISKGGLTLKHELSHALFLRGTAGRLVAPDTLVYGSAGLGYGKFEMTGTGPGGSASFDYSATGYTLGLGVEKALNDQLSVFGDYEYANFGKTAVDMGGVTTYATPEWHSINVGLNYSF